MPYGIESAKRKIAEMTIVNRRGTADLADYDYEVMVEAWAGFAKGGMNGVIRNFARKKRNVWALIRAVIEDASTLTGR